MSGPVIQRIKEIEADANATYFDPLFDMDPGATWYQCSICHFGWETGDSIRHHIFVKYVLCSSQSVRVPL